MRFPSSGRTNQDRAAVPRDEITVEQTNDGRLGNPLGEVEVIPGQGLLLGKPGLPQPPLQGALLAERRRRQLPTPTLPTPQRRELIDDIELEPADPARYDRFCHDTEEDSHGTT